ncbi:MAG: hypothetical protein WD773_11630 [Gemmatimonadales bacterium]
MKRLALILLLGACTEQVTAPGVCPNFCPGGAIDIKDTIFTDVIERDSAFRGYLRADQADAMTVADIPGVVDSRAIFRLTFLDPRVTPTPGDTTTVPISVDSARLRVQIVRRDRNSANLRLNLYRLPSTVDSASTFAQLDPDFSGPVIDSVNISDLLARPPIGDTATVRIWGDTIRTDSAGHTLQIVRADSSLVLYFDLDTTQAPFVAADSGRLGWGVRVAADSLASAALGASGISFTDRDPLIRWFYHYPIPDTLAAPDSVVHTSSQRATSFDSFVFDPPHPPLDDNLTVGGAPSARSLLRVAMPAFLHDSFDVVRATVILVPVAAVVGARGDSFVVRARPVLTDLGAKSPISPAAAFYGGATIRIGSADTVRIELSDLIRAWALDTSATTAFMLDQLPEAASYTEIRFYSSRTPAFRPALHVTYVKRFPFGTP